MDKNILLNDYAFMNVVQVQYFPEETHCCICSLYCNTYPQMYFPDQLILCTDIYFIEVHRNEEMVKKLLSPNNWLGMKPVSGRKLFA